MVTVDAVSVLLDSHRLNQHRLALIDNSGETPFVALASLSLFPGDNSTKALDIAGMLEKAQDHGKANPHRVVPPSIPMALPES